MSQEREVIVSLKNVSKSFDGKKVIDNLNLSVYSGEFLTLLGPSGCGKTTTLRMIAGFEKPDVGNIFLSEVRINDVSANERPVNTVFQSYALFPHMTVFDNVAFGLKMHKVKKEEIKKRVMDVLSMVELTEYIDRKPAQLSGGQQQRVALARALVNEPKLLLLDEPLSALDASLRHNMQNELKLLQKKLGIAFVMVTHDREEALSMSDRVIVMHDGVIEQEGTPKNLYEEPASLFVASFIGDVNILEGKVEKIEDDGALAIVEGRRCTIKNKEKLKEGERFHLLLRPEDMRIEKLSEDPNTEGLMIGKVKTKTYKGATLDSIITLSSGKEVKASEFFDEEYEDFDYKMGENVSVGWVAGWEVILPIKPNENVENSLKEEE